MYLGVKINSEQVGRLMVSSKEVLKKLQNVIQVITDNAPNCKNARQIIES